MNGVGFNWVKLEAHNGDTLELLPELYDGAFNLNKLDLGYPTPKDVEREVPFMDGTIDSTELHGPRVVTAEIDIYSYDGISANQWLKKLNRWLHPANRYKLAFHIDGHEEAQSINVRPQGRNQAWTIDRPSYLQAAITWKGPTGTIDSYIQRNIIIRPDAVEIGREYPLIYPRWYENIGPISGAIAYNGGIARAKPIIRIYGPITTPAIYNDTEVLGTPHTQAFVFKNNFQILEDNYVEIDIIRRKITLNSIESQSLLHELNFNLSSWWALSPGDNQLRLLSDAYGGAAQAQILWHDAYV